MGGRAGGGPAARERRAGVGAQRDPGVEERRLPPGGGALLRAWKAERNYRPKLEPKGLPEKVPALLGNAVADLWKAAQADAAAEPVAERERLEVDRRAALEIMDEAEMARLRERLARHEDGMMSAATATGA